LIEGFNAHWLLGDHSDHSSITRLNSLWFSFNDLTGSSIDFAFELIEFASNMSSVAIEYGGISLLDLTWMVKNDDLSEEVGGVLSWIILGVRSDETSSKIFN